MALLTSKVVSMAKSRVNKGAVRDKGCPKESVPWLLLC